MKAKNIFKILICFFLLSSTLSEAIQDEEFQKQRRTRENIITLRLLRMTRALDLTEEQTAKIFPVVSRIEKEKIEIYKQIREQMKKLRLILKDKDPDQKELKNRINTIKELRNLIKNKDEELEAYIEENITLIQQAKYVIFSVGFYRDLRGQLERARMMRKRLQQKDKKRF